MTPCFFFTMAQLHTKLSWNKCNTVTQSQQMTFTFAVFNSLSRSTGFNLKNVSLEYKWIFTFDRRALYSAFSILLFLSFLFLNDAKQSGKVQCFVFMGCVLTSAHPLALVFTVKIIIICSLGFIFTEHTVYLCSSEHR